MGYTFDKKTSFSIEGSRWRRLNPDGTYPAVDNHQGFLGTIDVSGLTASANMLYRLNGQGAFTTIVVDFTAMTFSDDTEATVAEVVTGLNLDSAFSAVFTASEDSTTERLKIVETADTATYLEFAPSTVDNITELLGLGAYSGNALGFGTHFIDCFDNSGALGLPKEIKDFEEIEIESGDGSTISMVTAALLKGLNPSLALNDESWELKELIMGGSNDQTVTGVSNRYTPPTGGQVYLPGFAGEVYEAKYDKGSNLRNNMTGYKRLNLNNCNGIEGDLNDEVKAWATYQYNLRVREYFISGTRYPGYTEDFLSLAEFDTLGITAG
ncbi:MAG: hypothetical protein DRP09_13790 [Candidatus Thorarchaeota archaeon]|nr:MAG: hypothetical protein DRP09_13790 [Candidatus Thorarchaeota archaeon]